MKEYIPVSAELLWLLFLFQKYQKDWQPNNLDYQWGEYKSKAKTHAKLKNNNNNEQNPNNKPEVPEVNQINES